MIDISNARKDFPVLSTELEGRNPIYFDNACMTLKPVQVTDAIMKYYHEYPGCGGRSVHDFATMVTNKYDDSRTKLKNFINASRFDEIVFTRNTTEAINLVAHSFWFEEGDIVLTTDKEHNANLVPWHLIRQTKGTSHDVVLSNEDNTFNIENFKERMDKKVKLVSMTHTANLDGVTNPVRDIIEIAHDNGALVMLDAAQSVPHQKVDVQELDVDFFAFSIHKMVGPTGMGILFGKHELLDRLDPFIGGGGSVQQTCYTDSKFLPPPEKFEAGLQNYAGAIGAGAAVDYLLSHGLDEIHDHEVMLNKLVSRGLADQGCTIIGPEDPSLRGGITSFNIPGIDPHEVSMFVNEMSKIMIRSGLHCVHSWFTAKNINGSARASFYLYNTSEEVKLFLESIEQLIEIMG